jgi:peptidoglycan/xylan/chitin deacetylase (PgdA/CDA1 family)
MKDASSPLVLMYHGITSEPSQVPEDRETGAGLYDVSLENFKAQMSCLKDKGHVSVLFEDFKTINGPKGVVISFDDGELNNFRNAFPVLKDFGWKAYFFVIVKRIGKKGYMDWKELKELRKAGMVIGSHGLSHEILTNLLDSQMEEELRASKKNLEINLGEPIEAISIPRGFCNDRIIDTAYRLGYKIVLISERPSGLKSGCFSRVAVKSSWTLKRFDQALARKVPLLEIGGTAVKKVSKSILRESGYNWVRAVLIKLFR